MLYVKRDENGDIIGLQTSSADPSAERKTLMDEEVLEFLNRNAESDPLLRMLALSDIGIIRIVEDLIDLLIQKQIIMFTDLPAEAQEKIRSRKEVRQKMDHANIMVDDVL